MHALRTAALAAATMMCAIVATVSHAADQGSALTDRKPLYRAVEALRAAMAVHGVQVDVPQLLRHMAEPGVAEQSTLPEKLQAAAGEYGMAVQRLDGLTAAELRATSHPLILLLRPRVEAERADHLILLRAVRGDDAVLLRYGTDELIVPLRSLMLLWDGSVLVVTKDAAGDHGVNYRPARLQLTFVILGCCGIVGLFVGVRRNRNPASTSSIGRTGLQAACVLAMAALAAVSLYVPIQSRLLLDVHAAAAEHRAVIVDLDSEGDPLTASAVKDITAEELKELLATADILFVDARPQENFARRRVRGAINLDPISAANARVRLAGVPANQLMVVYCPNITCGRGRAAAHMLMQAGFTNVLHYPPGWADLAKWSELPKSAGAEDE
jgi:rhodanese-related sulfurtransferase